MKSPCFRRSMGRFPSHFYWILLFLRFLRRLGNLLRSGCTTQASRSPSSLRLQNWRHCGVSRLRKQTKQTSPVAADKCSKKKYREAFNTVFSACCVFVGSGYGRKLGIQKKTRLGHTNFSGTETQFVAQTGWLPVAGEYGDPNHSAR